ncbi:phosphoenolpyruvate--protein phosphotransferase [Ornithinicoccus hortensis]|uniref:Phosphocarrier protein HPr n=1 Tax=Ornithinicoccus hortensis TaxID=82346 RepID=A0A542YS05_9MICO|nr:phosphoenolpyruvate--protein phosphotransferase [Ornithinicoccus hortensis]TQL50882.1 phosphocarrier protein HPr /phosphoenolpyruvate--protein phosphotransferase /dihydroxyacetone kinase DhaM subunit [Ornithinicoccus hortensis]
MIGIVVVSHSHPLASAAVALAAEMVQEADRPRIEVAAGLDETTFGTDAAAVAEAIGRADSGDGVLVLLDLGSAVLSAEMALEFVDPEVADRVVVSSAPLVEGLVAAAVTAGTGAPLDQVAAEAGRGLAAKVDHLGTDTDAGSAGPTDGIPEEAQPLPDDAVRARVEVTAPHGLHARPAARFVQCVNLFAGTRVQVSNPDSGRGPVDGRSLTAIATLDARQGHRLDLAATGDHAQEALDALVTLAATGFGDQPDRAAPAESAGPDAAPFSGLRAAVGPVHRPEGAVDLSGYAVGDAAQEGHRLDAALARAAEELTALADRTAEQVGREEGAVFEAHLGLLGDPSLLDPVRAAIGAGTGAPAAWQERVEALRAEFAGLPDAYQRERAQDVSSVGDRVLRALAGGDPAGQDQGQEQGGTEGGQRPVVLVVEELDPATAATLDPATTAGVLTTAGGATGHGVLVARARGVPLLTGVAAVRDVPEGTVVAFDEDARRCEVDPDGATLAEFDELMRERGQERERLGRRAQEPALTTDGHRIAVKANLASVAEAAQAAAAGAEGSGLVRTEVLFGDRTQAPSVADQVAAFEAIAEALPGRGITIRTWDVGGDKPLPFHPQPEEANPFLGVRGIRSFREDPTLLVDQLEAVCRVARHHPVRVMFPMVTTVEEVDWALARLDEASHRLADGRPDALQVGIMVEVPAAALRAEALTTVLDFVSIGSNDLTQYTLAAERGSPFLDGIADAADPAVLRLVRETCEEVADGVQVCVCGDAAGDPDLALLLVGLGVRELSATTASVPAVKDVLRRHGLTDLEDLADRAVHADSAADVRDLVRRFRAGESRD